MAPKMDKGKEVVVTGCELLRGGFVNCSEEIKEVIALVEAAGLEYVFSEPVPVMQREVLEFYETARVSSHGNSIKSIVAGEEVKVTLESLSIMLQLPRPGQGQEEEEVTLMDIEASFTWCGHSGHTQGSIRRFDLNTRGKLLADLVGKVFLCKPGSHDRISKDMFDVLCRLIQGKLTDWSVVLFNKIKGSLPNPSFGRILSLYLLNAMGDSINRKMGSSLHYSKKLDYRMIERWGRVIPKSAKDLGVLKKKEAAKASSSSEAHPNPAQIEGEGLLTPSVVELAPTAVPESEGPRNQEELGREIVVEDIPSAPVECVEKESLDRVEGGSEAEAIAEVVTTGEIEEVGEEGATVVTGGVDAPSEDIVPGPEGEKEESLSEGGKSGSEEEELAEMEEEEEEEDLHKQEVKGKPSSATLVYARKKSLDTSKLSSSVQESRAAVEGEDPQESSALDALVEEISKAVEGVQAQEMIVSSGKRPREEETQEEGGRPEKKVWVTGHPDFLVTNPYGKIVELGSSSTIINPVQMTTSLPGNVVEESEKSPTLAEAEATMSQEDVAVVARGKAPSVEEVLKKREEEAPGAVGGSLFHLINGLLQQQTRHMEAFVRKEVAILRKELKEEVATLKADNHHQNVQQAHFLLNAGPLLSKIEAHMRENKDSQAELMDTFIGQSTYVHAANQEIVNFMDADRDTILNRMTADKNEVLARMTHDRDEVLTRITIETNDLDEHLLDVRNLIQAGNADEDEKLLIIRNAIQGVVDEVQKGEKEVIEAGAEQAMWTANQLRNALTHPPTRYEMQEPSTGTDEGESDIGESSTARKEKRISNPRYLRRRTREINSDPYLGQLSPTSKQIVSNYWINFGYLEDEPGRFYGGQEWNRYKEQEQRRWRHKKSFPHGPPPSPKRIPKPYRYFERQLEKHKQAASTSGRGAASTSGRGAASTSGRQSASSRGRGRELR